MANDTNTGSTGQFAETEQEKEPMLLLDTTGSMNYHTSATDPTPRKDTIREAISIIVDKLAAEDSQASKEEEGGGIRTITFADGTAHRRSAHCCWPWSSPMAKPTTPTLSGIW